MKQYFAGWLAAAAVMIGLDAVWLGLIAKTTYQNSIGHLMAGQPNLAAAAGFYGLYALGVMVFVAAPQAKDSSWSRTLAMGALFGLVAYGTYDLSNLATLKGWPALLSVIDMAWGALLTAVSAGAAKAALNWARA